MENENKFLYDAPRLELIERSFVVKGQEQEEYQSEAMPGGDGDISDDF